MEEIKTKKKTKAEKKADRKETFELMLEFLHGSKHLFIISIIASGIAALAEMISPQIIRAAVDNAIGGKKPDLPQFVIDLVDKLGGFAYIGKHLWIMALALVAVSLIQVTAQYIYRVYNTKAAEMLVKSMRDKLYDHISRLPYSWHMKNHTGDIIQRCTSDIDTTKNFLSQQLTSIVRIVILLVLSVVFMMTMDIKLTLIALAPMPIVLAYSVIFHNQVEKGFIACDENEGKLSALAQENLTGVRVVRAFGREKNEIDKFRKQNEYYTGLWKKMAKQLSLYWTNSDIISGIQILLVVVFGAVYCISDSMTEGEYIAFISYNMLMLWPLRQLGRMISEMSKAGVSIDRVKYIMSSPVERDDSDATDADMTGDIRFENVTFGYEGCPDILKNMSFEVKAGTTLGILGGTGSGKSTIVLLLDKMYNIAEGNGRITIGGTDIRKIKTSCVRNNIGLVLQEPYLFSGTISENIGISCENADETQIKTAATSAALDESIEAFANGYDTVVGERGVTLSGGQKQRTAIARTLVKDTPILVFDDSLSAVDTETDAKIRHAIAKKFGKATVIIISHRITTLSAADKIIVLENGGIAEEGTHDELKNAGGIYQKIYETQSYTGGETL